MPINEITEKTRKEIENRSVKNLPDSPSNAGYSPDMIKRRMYGFITDHERSLIAEVNRIVKEINETINLDSLDGIFVGAHEPTDWKPGDFWYDTSTTEGT